MQWQEFRPAYKQLKTLKNEFFQIPIMLLKATAPPEVQSELISIVWNISKGNIDRQNIYFECEEVESGDKEFSDFATRVSQLIGNECAIIYTDFIRHVGPFLNHRLVQKQLRSVIKKSEHYSIQGILVVQDKGREVAADRKSVVLPKLAGNVCCIESSPTVNTYNTNVQEKSKGKTRLGKGAHGLSIVRHFLAEKKKWTRISKTATFLEPQEGRGHSALETVKLFILHALQEQTILKTLTFPQPLLHGTL